MLIVCEKSENIINFGNGCRVFATDNGCVKYTGSSGDWCKIADYASKEQAKASIRMMAESAKRDVFYMPSVEEINAYLIRNGKERNYHATGKKTKGHGGS